MKVLGISGYYGMCNYGDDLFSIAAYTGSQKYWLNYKPRLLCPPIEGLSAQYGYPKNFPTSLFQYHNLIGQLLRSSIMSYNSLIVDEIVFAGGSLFHSGKINVRSLVFFVRKGIKRYSAIGVSVGPFKNKTHEKIVHNQLKKFDYIATRDKISYDRLVAFGLDCKIVLSADLAGIIPNLMEIKKDSKSSDNQVKKVGFSPCFLPDRSKLAKDFCDAFIDVSCRLANEVKMVVDVICLNTHYKVGDINLCLYARNQLVNKGIFGSLFCYRDLGVLETWRKIARLDSFFSARLHGAVTAYLSGVPFFLLEHHEKCSEFLDFVKKPAAERLSGVLENREHFLNAYRSVLLKEMSCGMLPKEFCQLSEINFTESPLC